MYLCSTNASLVTPSEVASFHEVSPTCLNNTGNELRFQDVKIPKVKHIKVSIPASATFTSRNGLEIWLASRCSMLAVQQTRWYGETKL